MALFIQVLLAFAIINLVSALTIPNPPMILPASTTVGSTITNATNSHYIHQCSGMQGYNLNSASCLEALRQIDILSTTQHTYGVRFKGLYDVKLPQRYISCSFPPRPLAYHEMRYLAD